MQQDQLIKIEQKLDMILKVITSVIVENKNFDEKITFLSNIGFSDNTIAEISNVKPVTVRARKSTLKKRKK
jgi:hypothetical protein